ncbi:MAG TPA: hypothetical protein VMV69_26755 [Pirellulales bacterium]|nr:hypothetical protein [Pirellulales bacterium]
MIPHEPAPPFAPPHLGRADAVAGYVTISSLNRALERERAAAGDRPGYED